MGRFDSVELEQLDERPGPRQIAEDPHRRLRPAFAQRRRERDLIAVAPPTDRR
jgi:hypothetical protein